MKTLITILFLVCSNVMFAQNPREKVGRAIAGPDAKGKLNRNTLPAPAAPLLVHTIMMDTKEMFENRM